MTPELFEKWGGDHEGLEVRYNGVGWDPPNKNLDHGSWQKKLVGVGCKS